MLIDEGNSWVAPLSFHTSRSHLPNNREQARSHFNSLCRTLEWKAEMNCLQATDLWLSPPQARSKPTHVWLLECLLMICCWLHQPWTMVCWEFWCVFGHEQVKYRMWVHIFGNSPSPVLATYSLRWAALHREDEFGNAAKEFIHGVLCKQWPQISALVTEAVSLLKMW